MLPRVAQAVFDHIAAHSSCATTTGAAGSVKYSLEVQFLEIYQEGVIDLLTEQQQQQPEGASGSSSNLKSDVIIREGALD